MVRPRDKGSCGAGKTLLALASVAMMGSPLGCVSAASGRGTPLYPTSDHPRQPEEIAQLGGYVMYVDGKEVSAQGPSFELLPGCHLVGTPSKWGTLSPESGGAVLTTGHQLFALPMRAGYFYVVEIGGQSSDGIVGSVALQAVERDAAGQTVHVFAPASGRKDIEECNDRSVTSARG